MKVLLIAIGGKEREQGWETCSDMLILRMVHRINRYIHPDLVIIRACQ